MADERIGIQLDLGPSTPDVKKLGDALKTVATTASAQTVPSLKEVAAAARATEKAQAELGRGVQSVSYAFQDFTSVIAAGGGFGRAIGSIQNNIPQLITQFGGGAGLAGVISIASVAVGLLIDNFGRLYKAWNGGQTEKETERLEKLAEAAGKAKEALDKAIEAAKNQKSADESKIGPAVTAMTGGPDFDKVVDNITGLDETTFARQRNELEVLIEKYTQVEKKAQRLGQTTRARAASELVTETRGQIEALERERSNAQAMVVAARGGNMAAYDDLLKRTSGDVRDNLAAADPRKAGAREFSRGQAKAQISDAIGDFMQPLISGLKERLKKEKEALAHDKAIDAWSEQGGKGAKRALKQDERSQEEAEREAEREAEKERTKEDRSRIKDSRDAERARKQGSREFFANPDYSPEKLREMDARQQASAMGLIVGNERLLASEMAEIKRQWQMIHQQAETVPPLLRNGQ